VCRIKKSLYGLKQASAWGGMRILTGSFTTLVSCICEPNHTIYVLHVNGYIFIVA
jgi:hypothetical protein